MRLATWGLTVRKTVHASGLIQVSLWWCFAFDFLVPFSSDFPAALSRFDHCLTRATPRSNFVPTLGQLVFMLPAAAVVSLPNPQPVGSAAEFRGGAPCFAIFPCACAGRLSSHSPSSLSTNEALSSRPHDPLGALSGLDFDVTTPSNFRPRAAVTCPFGLSSSAC